MLANINKNLLKINKKVGKKQAKHKRQLVHRKRNTKSFQRYKGSHKQTKAN